MLLIGKQVDPSSIGISLHWSFSRSNAVHLFPCRALSSLGNTLPRIFPLIAKSFNMFSLITGPFSAALARDYWGTRYWSHWDPLRDQVVQASCPDSSVSGALDIRQYRKGVLSNPHV